MWRDAFLAIRRHLMNIEVVVTRFGHNANIVSQPSAVPGDLLEGPSCTLVCSVFTIWSKDLLDSKLRVLYLPHYLGPNATLLASILLPTQL